MPIMRGLTLPNCAAGEVTSARPSFLYLTLDLDAHRQILEKENRDEVEGSKGKLEAKKQVRTHERD